MRLVTALLATRPLHSASHIQRLMLAVGSGVAAISDPSRADMINAFGELTGEENMRKVRDLMRSDPEGALILADRPVINSQTVDLDKLAELPAKTFGREYIEFLKRHEIHPDERQPVRFIEDQELAYVMNRYRQIHDFTHCILGMKTNMLGEL
jgi:ubiquinone biosynthesis protein COQ4